MAVKMVLCDGRPWWQREREVLGWTWIREKWRGVRKPIKGLRNGLMGFKMRFRGLEIQQQSGTVHDMLRKIMNEFI
jgi:hypothetical protein